MENNMMQFEIVRNVTLPFLMIAGDGTPSYVKFNTAIEPDTSTFSERVRKSKNDGEQRQEPMHIAEVTNLQTGEVARLVAHSVLESQLNEAYPDNSYVGRNFKIEKTKAAGKRYFNFNIVEIRLKSQAATAENHSKGAKK